MKRIAWINAKGAGTWTRFSPPWLVWSALALIGSLACCEIADFDFWWHLRTGQVIVETGAIPRQDPFSFSAAGYPWTAHEWLFEVCLFLVYRIGGWPFVIAAKALLVTATLAVVAGMAWYATSHETWTALITLLTAWATRCGWMERPQLVTYLFLVLTLTLLRGWQRGAPPRRLLALPVLTAAWVNFHGGYVVLFLVLAVYVAVGLGRWWRSGRAAEEGQRVRFLVILSGLCGAASLLNPHTYQALLYPLQYLGPSIHKEYIQEWQSPTFGGIMYTPFLLLWVGTVVALIWTRAPLRVESLVLCGLFGVMAFQARRHVPLFALAAAPVLAECVGTAWQRWKENLAQGTSWSGSAPRRAAWLLPALGAAALLLTVQGAWASWRIDAHAALPLDPGRFPVGAVAYLRDHPQPGRMFNHYAWGGYLIWHLPEQRVFIDGRADMYGPEILEDYMTVCRLKPGWKRVLDKYFIDWILCPVDQPLAAALGETGLWKRIHADETSAIFSRRAQN